MQGPVGARTRAQAPAHVVGIGAGSGGLEALERFFAALPEDSGLVFMLVDPWEAEPGGPNEERLLQAVQGRPVVRARAGEPVEADAIYLVPPGQTLTLRDGRLVFESRARLPGGLPVDAFFESLALALDARAIGLVLSGAGSDGARGARVIDAVGGLVLAQRPATARCDGMPRAAWATGACAAALDPEEMPGRVLAFVAEPDAARGSDPGLEVHAAEDELAALFAHLRRRFGLDFSEYRATTVGRRIGRRLEFHGLERLGDYLRLLEADPGELEHLYRDLLIGVTQFFRDPEAFEVLETQVVPRLFHEAGEDGVRVWVPACATGEEAYSLAMLLQERAAAVDFQGKVVVLATDVHRRSLEVGSAGVYTAEQTAGLPARWLERAFTRESGDLFKVRPELRRTVIFAPHNLLDDPPFTRMDLISCRNLLIYLLPEAQEKVVATLGYALRSEGVLFLGSSEGPNRFGEGLAPIAGGKKLYRKVGDFPFPLALRSVPTQPADGASRTGAPRPTTTLPRRLLRDYDLLLSRFMPPGVLLDERLRPLHYFGEVGPYLLAPSGRTGGEFAQGVLPELQLAVAVALQRAATTRSRFVVPSLPVPRGEGEERLDVTVDCLHDERDGPPHFIVTFTALRAPTPLEPGHVPPLPLAGLDASPALRAHLADLEQELSSTRESLRATVEELQTSNEELQATNEELLAANEELQSTNEELHSFNEELHTVNAEFEKKNLELQNLNLDHDQLLESLATGIVFVDANLAIRRFNRASASCFRLLPHDIGRPLDDIAYLLADQERLMADIRRVLVTGVGLEAELPTKDGKWVLQRLLPYFDDQRVLKGVLMTSTDITALKVDQAKTQALFDLLPAGVTVVAPGGRLVDANAESLRLLSMDLAGLQEGRYKSRTYLRADGTAMVPEDFATARALRARSTVRDVETGVVLDGETVRWLNVSAAPLPDGGVVTVLSDLSARKALESRLRRWEDIFQNVAWGIVVGYPNSPMLGLLNRAFAEMHGYAVDELVGRPIALVFPESEHEGLRANIALAHEKGHHLWESVHLRKDGSTFPVLIDVVVVKDAAGTDLYRIVSVHDISERRRAEQALAESAKLLGRKQKLEALGTLAGGIAHDFNNILLAIRGNARLAAEEAPPEGQVASMLQEIERAGARATALVSQILSFARPQEPNRTPVDLRELARQAVQFLRAAIPARVELDLVLTGEVPSAVVDTDQVHQALVNVVTNAFHAIGERAGRVEVSVDAPSPVGVDEAAASHVAPGRYVRIAVRDDGCGMSAETLARACDPFFTTKGPQKGTGLGLSIVHSVVTAHQGGLLLESEPGRGTVVRMLFPATSATPVAADAAPQAAPAPSQAGRGDRVMVVEDDAAVARIARMYLARRGFVVDVVLDPRDAIEALRAHPDAFDVLVTDLSMPALSGLEVIAEARRLRPSLPVVLTTGNLCPEDEDEARRLVVDEVVQKPYSVESLASAVARALSRAEPGTA